MGQLVLSARAKKARRHSPEQQVGRRRGELARRDASRRMAAVLVTRPSDHV